MRTDTARLVIVAPREYAGRSVHVDPGGTLVGRGSGCGLILGSELVSRRHAMIRYFGGTYLVEDLGSSNGTLLNGTPVTTARPLGDGDRLSFGNVEVELRVTSTEVATPGRSEPGPHEPWRPGDPTRTFDPSPARPRRSAAPSLRQELHSAPAFSRVGLLLAVLGSVVGTVVTSTLGTGQWGTLTGAALGPVLSTTFSTGRAGQRGRVRKAAIVILSIAALVITVTGFSIADVVAGRSVLPGSSDRPTTFLDLGAAAPGHPGIRVEPRSPTPLGCGELDVGLSMPCDSPVTITSTGTAALRVTGGEVTGPDRQAFEAGRECVGKSLAPRGSCEMTVRFRPSVAGTAEATLVIHQNLPRPDTGTAVSLAGTGRDGGAAGPTLRVVVRSVDATDGTPLPAPVGTVRSRSGELSCPEGTCAQAFPAGTTVELEAVLDPGASVSWDGCRQLDALHCSVDDLTEPRQVTATLSR